MKKALIVSIVFNFAIVSFLVGKRYYYSHHSFFNGTYDYNIVRGSIFTSLSIDSSDIVFVGNSLTEGFMVSEFFGPHFKNRGINGNRIINIINRIDPIINGHPKKIFLEGGINDISYGSSPEAIISNYKKLIEEIKGKGTTTTIYVQSILPTSKEYNQKEKIIATNKLLKDCCNACGVTFIDLYKSFESDGYLKNTYTYDGIHLNGTGYLAWAKEVQLYL